jgi:hypothetical protein
MNARRMLGLSVVGSLALAAGLVVVLDTQWRAVDRASEVSADPRYPVSPTRGECDAVVKWLRQQRQDFADLELDWGPSRRIIDNPITREPATVVQVILRSKKTKDADAGLEYWHFYLKNEAVLGAVSRRPGDPELLGPPVPERTTATTSAS